VAGGSAPGTAADTTHMRSPFYNGISPGISDEGCAAITGRPARKANGNASLLTSINPGTGGPSSPLGVTPIFVANNSWRT
jgi:hypothetical protein